MSVADRFRRAADVGRRAAAAVAQRPVSVTIVTEAWSAAIDTDGATLSSTTSTTLVPAPKVAFGADVPSVFGGGLRSGPNPNLSAGEARIGPITPAFAGGGYDPATLLPTPADATERTYLVLAGDGLASGGERYDVVAIDASYPQRWYITARRTQQS